MDYLTGRKQTLSNTYWILSVQDHQFQEKVHANTKLKFIVGWGQKEVVGWLGFLHIN
jgi:hypothetical protein